MPPLQAYLLGSLALESVHQLQRRLAYEVSGSPLASAVIVCEHPPSITIGRHGSRGHLRLTDAELLARNWPVRWVARGGGVVLHLPGQVAFYPVVPLEVVGLTPAAYVRTLAELVLELLASFGIVGEADFDAPAIRVRGRRIAHIGVAIRNGVTGFGIVVNVAPDLESFRGIDCDGDARPMTSLQRECPQPVRIAAVRQRLLELLAARLGFERWTVFHNHPTSLPRTTRHAIAHTGR